MRKTVSRILVIMLSFVLVNSCRKDFAKEENSNNPPSIKPDLTIKVVVDVAGFIIDENENPVMNALVTAGNKQANTDEFGYFKIESASLPKVAGLIKVVKEGYFTGYKTIHPNPGIESFLRLELVPRNNPSSIDASAGGSANIDGGAMLVLPASSVVIASSGISYSGTINVFSHWLNPADIRTMQLQSPGDTRGTDDEGFLRLLNSYSMIAVELMSTSGELLQIAPGKQAILTMPVPAPLITTAPSAIPLWSFDEQEGLWKQEGVATRSGNNYSGNVSHFSFWTGAIGLPLVEFTAQVLNTSLLPMANVAVGIRPSGQAFNSGLDRFGFTDANGMIHGSVPANWQLILSVMTPCQSEAYSLPFTTTNADVDLGTITGNMGQGVVTLSGTAVNCSGLPVTNGYIQTYDNGFFNRINIVNGAFSMTVLACTNTVTHFIAVDADSYQQSAVQTLALTPGNNDLGNLVACGTSTVGTMTFTIDGVTRVLSGPADTLASYFTPGGWTTIVNLDEGQNANPDFLFQFDGSDVTGSGHKITEIFSTHFPGGRASAPVPLTVNITEFGLPGGFIQGSFSGMVLDVPANGIHNISCEFRIKRYN